MSTRWIVPVLAAGLASAVLGGAAAAAESQRLVRHTYRDVTGEPRDSFVLLPEGYEAAAARRWPLLLFLHGDGERGDGRGDLDWVLVHGPLYEAWVQKRDLPFVIVAPQLPLYGRNETIDYLRDRDASTIPRRLADGVPARPDRFPTPQPMAPSLPSTELPFGPEGLPDGWPRREADLLTILDEVIVAYRIDRSRVYLSGLSYGGFGTWHFAARHPERFAAIAPVAGWGHPEHMAPLARHRVPVWAFAGGRDPVVPPKHFYAGLNELERLGGAELRFTVHEDAGHDVWKRVYASEDLYAWLLQHQREDGDAQAAPAPP